MTGLSRRPRLHWHLWLCSTFVFQLNFHLLAEFDIKHTLICLHTRSYWLPLPCSLHFSAPRQLNLHGGLAQDAMIKLMMWRFQINSQLKALGGTFERFRKISPWLFFVLPPSSTSATSAQCVWKLHVDVESAGFLCWVLTSGPAPQPHLITYHWWFYSKLSHVLFANCWVDEVRKCSHLISSEDGATRALMAQIKGKYKFRSFYVVAANWFSAARIDIVQLLN